MFALPPSIWRGIAQLLCVVIAALALPAAICRSQGLEHALRLQAVRPSRVFLGAGNMVDAESGRALMRREQPAWVLLGNSMLNSRIDPEHLTEMCGQPVLKLGAAGSKSPVWYLILKQVVLGTEEKPRCVTIFFREKDLTWPESEMARNEVMVERLNGRADPEWPRVMGRYDAQVYSPYSQVVKGTAQQLEELLPGEKLRVWARGKLQKTAFKLSSWQTDQTDDERREELNERLSLDHQRQDVPAAKLNPEQAGASEKERAAEDSAEPSSFNPEATLCFLPQMIQLAREHGVKLHFHRVRYRYYEREKDTLADYMAAMRSYLTQHGCYLTDEGELSGVTVDMYADDYHIQTTPEVQRPFMQLWWSQVQPVVQKLLQPQRGEKQP